MNPKTGSTCLTCVGYQWYGGHGYMAAPDGEGTNGVLLVGEALGEQEAKTGRPFAGKAGLALVQMFQRVGLRREDFLIDNCLRCRPPDNKLSGEWYAPDALRTCAHHLDETIARFKPRCIVALGATAFHRLLPAYAHIGVLEARGYVFWSEDYQTWVIPTYHPAYIMRGNQRLTGVFLYDIQHAVKVAKEGHTPRRAEGLEDPTPAEAMRYAEAYREALAHDAAIRLALDIETPEKAKGTNEGELDPEDDPTYTILRIGFCYEDWRGMTIPFTPPYYPAIRLILESPGVKIIHNEPYDAPRLEANAFFIGGVIWDSMLAWHVLNSDLEKGLGDITPFFNTQIAMWKHLSGAQPAYYNLVDAVVTWQNMRGIEKGLHEHRLWGVFDRHILQYDVPLRGMSRAGVLLDAEERKAFSGELEEKLTGIQREMDGIVPNKAHRFETRKRKPLGEGWQELPARAVVKVCSLCGKKATKVHPCFKEDRLIRGEIVEQTIDTSEWIKPLPFVPSNLQMTLYQSAMNHKPVPKKGKGSKRADGSTKTTFDEEALKVLMKRYPNDCLYPKVLEYRETEKILGTYVGRWVGDRFDGGMPVRSDGRVHTFYTHNPSTLRLSSKAPNLQNVPRASGEGIGVRVKDLFVAAPGHVLLECDFSAIEAVLVGYFAGSRTYIRLAKLGVHDYLNSHILARDKLIAHPADLAWSDGDLAAFFADLKARFDVQRDIAKRVVHLCVGGDHEVLTPTGWVRLDQLPPGAQVAQWDPRDGQLSFTVPRAYTDDPFDGQLVHLRTRSISVAMTPNHRVPVVQDNGAMGEIRAEALRGDGEYRIPLTGVLVTDRVESMDPDVIRLMVAAQADGAAGSSGLVFHFTKARKVERLEEILTRLELPYTKVRCGCHDAGWRIRLGQAEAAEALAWLDGSAKEFALAPLLRLPQTLREVFLDEIPHWDGSRVEHRRVAYYTMSRHNAEVVQTIAHVSGREALLRVGTRTPTGIAWCVSFNKRRFARAHKDVVTLVPHTGRVYCLTVETGAFLIRHNDRISVTGNSNYGGTPRKMAETYPETFRDEKNAGLLQRLYFDVCPDVKKWQEQTVAQADRSGYLRNPFGYLHRFWNVRSWRKEGAEWIPSWGEDAKRVLAFLPQSTAAGIIAEAIMRLWVERELRCMRLQIHDSILSEIRSDGWEETAHTIVGEMTTPVKELPLDPTWGMGSHLAIGVEGKVGERWGRGMRKWRRVG